MALLAHFRRHRKNTQGCWPNSLKHRLQINDTQVKSELSGTAPPILFSYRTYNIHVYIIYIMVAQTVRNLPTMQDTWVQSLGQEDPLEKGMATHSSILACRIPWTEEPGGPQSVGLQRVGHDWATNNSNSSYLYCYSSYLSYYWHDLTLIHHNTHHVTDMMLHLSIDS